MKAKIIMLVLVPLYLSACASAPPAKNVEAANIEQSAKQEAVVETGAGSSIAGSGSNAWAAQQQEMRDKSIYFDFDRFDIKHEYHEVIRQQAEFIKAGAIPVTLEGNADERGSSEYNLALGNRRANAVRKALEISGAGNSKINVVSFGEEKPRSSCHEEKCWAENRRVDFNLNPGK